MLGALRSSAQIVSYEIPLGMAILGVVLFAGSLNLEQVIEEQAQRGWNILFQPLAFIVFLTAVFAECNRLPFDLPEAEQELVGGYHTEYSALKFAMFFLGEYAHMVTTSYLVAIFFFGGWHLPWITGPGLETPVLKVVILGAKGAFFIVLFMMIRWTIPRFRFDQLMGLAWKTLIPLALVNLVAVMAVLELGLSRWWLLPISIALLLAAGFLAVRQPASARRASLAA
jgi:NADH-quinone oxidoreductase subunit H